MQRALLLALLAEGTTQISPIDRSNDSQQMLENIQKLGAKVDQKDGVLWIEGTGGNVKSNITVDCGESGFGLRSITPVLGCVEGPFRITGQGSLINRPIDLLVELYNSIQGVQFSHAKGKLPIEIKGKAIGGNIVVDGSKSSQHISGLLMGLPILKESSSVNVQNLKSEPYLNLTINMMRDFGVKTDTENSTYIIHPQKYRGTKYQVKGDWSGASFMLVGAYLHGKSLTIENLHNSSIQADKKIIDILQSCGASFEIGENFIHLKATTIQKAFEVDITHAPDLFPPLAVLASGIQEQSKLKGLHRLFHKESNRKESIMYLLNSFGVSFEEIGDELVVKGGNIKAPKNPVNTYNDHRIAMSAFILSGFCHDSTEILNTDCIDKSYPEFINDWVRLGGIKSDKA